MAAINDLWYEWLVAQVPAAIQAGTASATPGSSVPNSVTATSLVNSGSQTAPGAGTTIATLSGLTGVYEVQVQTMFAGTGTPVDADAVNIQYTDGNITLNLQTNVVKDTPSPVLKFYASGSAFTMNVKAVAAATANVVYKVNLIATKVG